MGQTRLLAAAALASLCLAGSAAAAPFSCGPVPAKEPKADAALAQAITSPRATAMPGSELRQAVRHLRAEGMANGAIVDHAVASYCPLVAGDSHLSIEQKREAVRRFAAELMAFVYDPADEDTAIILSLPIRPPLAERIDAAAAKANETRDAWVRGAIEAGLAAR